MGASISTTLLERSSLQDQAKRMDCVFSRDGKAMTVRKDPDKKNKWVVDFYFTFPDGRRKRIKRVSPVNTKRGAEQFERQLRDELLYPTEPVREVPTFRQYSKYLMQHATNNNKHSEICSKKTILKCHLLPFFGRLKLDAINRRLIEEYKAKKKTKGYAPKSINNHLTVLRKTISLAVEDDVLSHIPNVKWLRVPEQDFDFFDFDEAERLLKAAERDEEMWHVMIIVAMRTGLRQGELLALKWDDLDLKVGRLIVKRRNWRGNIDIPKGGRSREIPLTPELITILSKFRHLRGEWVFCREDGSPLTYGECKRPLWNICKLAGLRRIGWHVLRHTFCSHLTMIGVHSKFIMEYAGHTDIRITMRYSHLSPDVGREAIALLDHMGRKFWSPIGPRADFESFPQAQAFEQ